VIKLIDILKEGAYDSMTRTVVRDIMNSWKEQYVDEPKDLVFEKGYELEDAKDRLIEFDLEALLRVKQTKDQKYIVDGGVDQLGEPPYLQIAFQVDPRDLPQMWETIYYDLIDVVRHELEHFTQEGSNIISSKAMEDDTFVRTMINAKLLPKSEYFKLEKEVDAMLQGMYLKAKKTRTPFSKVISDYFDKVRLNKKDRKDILDLWSKRLKALNLPSLV